jgi:hypothetical protein
MKPVWNNTEAQARVRYKSRIKEGYIKEAKGSGLVDGILL